MKSRYQVWALGSAAMFIALFSNGCYTQFGSTQDEVEEVVRYEDEGDEYAYDDSVASDEDYNDARDRFYDENYYPGYAYGWGYTDPWLWRHRGGYVYDPFWYDPIWGWCGTTYPYYSGWWSHSGYGYLPSPYYGGHWGGGGYATRSGREYGSTRTFGSTRSEGGVRGSTYNPGERGTSGATMPNVGAYRAKSGVSGSSTKGTANRPARVTSPSGTRSSSRERTAVGTQRSSSRPNNSGRVARPSSPDNGGKSSSGGSGDRGSRSGGSYSPPSSSPASAPASTPPSSGGSHAPANTGERGGNRR